MLRAYYKANTSTTCKGECFEPLGILTHDQFSDVSFWDNMAWTAWWGGLWVLSAPSFYFAHYFSQNPQIWKVARKTTTIPLLKLLQAS